MNLLEQQRIAQQMLYFDEVNSKSSLHLAYICIGNPSSFFLGHPVCIRTVFGFFYFTSISKYGFNLKLFLY